MDQENNSTVEGKGSQNVKKYACCREELHFIESEILNGTYGSPGDIFISTRELSKQRKVSLVTAQKILTTLRKKGIIELKGKKYYLTYGRILKNTPLGKINTVNTHLLGLHVTNIESPFFAAIARNTQKYANASGYRLVIATSSFHVSQEIEILNMFKDIGVMGVISAAGRTKDVSELYNNYMLPHVFIGRKPENVVGEAVLVNNYPASKQVAEHFVKENFKSFAYVGLSDFDINQDMRYTGFCEGLKEHGFRLEKNNIVRVNIEDIAETNRRLLTLLKTQTEPTAIFCFHDLIATTLLTLCKKLNIACPKKIAIAGFDDLSVASLISPPITSVSYRIDEMSETAVRLIIAQIESGVERDTSYYIEPSLVIRQSTMKRAAVQLYGYRTRDIIY